MVFALVACGKDAPESTPVETNPTAAGNYNTTQQLLAKGRRFTALFVEADVMAIGAIRALHNNVLRVPRDVSVMGFDGLPQLSTVIQSRKLLARRSVEILIRQIEENAPARHESVPYSLQQSESTRRIDED